MGSPAVLEFDQLLRPIPGDQPTGANLREDRSALSSYQVVRSARTRARAAERKAQTPDTDDASAEVRPDWGPILQHGLQLLTDKSKDLEITAWLIEALVRRHGFAGLRDGFRLARELIERFWENLHPMPNEDGMITRVAALAGLNGVDGDGTLIAPINNIPLTQGKSIGPFARAHYKQASDLEGIVDPDRRAQRLARGAVSLEAFHKSAAETSTEFFRTVLDDVTQTIDEFSELTVLLDSRCGNGPDGAPAAPPSSNIRSALENCREIIMTTAKDRLGLVGSPTDQLQMHSDPEASFNGAAGGGGSRARGGMTAGEIQTRNEAFQSLLRVAQFFKETEPHSPVSYALEQAVRWGRMPLPDLLSELIPDPAALENVFKRVGIAAMKTP